jgi:demethylmenaquinone methyltransferase/2-methoxy-6-polyprenyl-1,4-benzoquinol methylase
VEGVSSDLVARFFTGTGKSYNHVVHLGTLGLDLYWKRKIYSKITNRPSAILDLACGTGIVTFGLHRRYPDARIVGVDVTPDYLEIARRRAEEERAAGVSFILADAVTVELNGSFDCVTSSYIPKYVEAYGLLENISPHVSAGGLLVLHDFAYPRNRIARAIWERYNVILNAVGRRLYPEWKTVFDYELTGLIRTSPWIEEFVAALQKHRYEKIEVERLSFGSAAVLTARKAGDVKRNA